MSGNNENITYVDDLIEPDITVSVQAVKQVEEIKDAVSQVIPESNLSEKMTELSTTLQNLHNEMDTLRSWRKTDYLEAIENMKSQVKDIQNEWQNVSSSVSVQREKLESLFQSFPGAVEIASIRAMSLRLSHLEQLIAQLFQESYAKHTARSGRRQMIISLVALGVTIVLWGVFIATSMM